jgi:hypothetical protein
MRTIERTRNHEPHTFFFGGRFGAARFDTARLDAARLDAGCRAAPRR